MTDMGPILELSKVSKSFQAGDDLTVDVLKGVDLVVKPGESVAIVGSSGSGKSTLLNLLGTLDRPTSGRVVLDGEDVSTLDEKALAAIRNRKLGFVFQLHHLLPQCTILENVLVPALINRDADGVEARARELLERVGLSHRLDHRPAQLSGGERQRAAVVRALVNDPKLLLADEPTGSLDRTGSDNLGDLLAELNREEKVTLIVVTHEQTLAERMVRQFTLRDGLLVEGA